jgi:hypothetical protein
MQLANQAADLFFYDVGALEPSEWRMLQPTLYGKGTIIVVSIRAAPRQHRIRHYTNTHTLCGRKVTVSKRLPSRAGAARR